MKNKPYMSICIPAYEMKGLGVKYLEKNFQIFLKQTFKNFEVVISDHSKNDLIYNLCKKYDDKLDIKYHLNTKNYGSSSANLNNAIKKAEGKLIKILFQDDFLYHENSLKEIVDNFNLKKDNWLITACEHTTDGNNFFRKFYPRYNKYIYLGLNTISSPSVLTIKNKNRILFDQKLIWLMDCDYYKRLHDNFGKPKIINKINAVNRVGNHQVSHSMVNKVIKTKEIIYILKKYFFKKPKIELNNVSLVAVSSIKIPETIKALKKSMRKINYKEAILISHEKPKNLPSNIIFKKCHNIDSLDKYSKFMLYDLYKYINSEFTLIAQYDGYVINPHKWKNVFLNYDYLGAPWPKNKFYSPEDENIRVGNGGFSLRSKRVLEFFDKHKIPFNSKGYEFLNEDGMICNYYKNKMENEGIKFSPVKIASLFSRELFCNDYFNKNSFGFHRYKNYYLQILKNFTKKNV